MAENADEKEKVFGNDEVITLAEMEVGETCRILSFDRSNQDKAGKLLALGLYPGLPVRLIQKIPSPVVEVGHTQLALDLDTAREIQVVRETRAGGCRHRHRHRWGFWRKLLSS